MVVGAAEADPDRGSDCSEGPRGSWTARTSRILPRSLTSARGSATARMVMGIEEAEERKSPTATSLKTAAASRPPPRVPQAPGHLHAYRLRDGPVRLHPCVWVLPATSAPASWPPPARVRLRRRMPQCAPPSSLQALHRAGSRSDPDPAGARGRLRRLAGAPANAGREGEEEGRR